MIPRPKKLTTERAIAAASLVAEELIKSGSLSATERDAAINNIVSVARLHMDGYELAKALDDKGWDCNRDMVDDLDVWAAAADTEMKKLEAEWAEATNIQPPYEAETRVTIPGGETGVIAGISPYGVAQYLVKIDGDPRAEPPTCARRVINFEDVKPRVPALHNM